MSTGITSIVDQTLGVHVVMDAAEVALTAGNVSYRNVFRYFCGVCWNRIRERSQ